MGIAIVAFCFAVVGYILWRELESKVAETAVTMAFFLLGSVSGSYIFGATWQDISLGKPRSSTSTTTTTLPPVTPKGDK
mgnify:CR=1 FL=1